MKTHWMGMGMLVACVVAGSMGCTALLVGAGAGAETGYVASQDDERSTGEVMSDQALTAKVKTALIANGDVAARNINVDSMTGVVTLRGFVRSEHELRQAIETTRDVSGVDDVKSKLSVQEDE